MIEARVVLATGINTNALLRVVIIQFENSVQLTANQCTMSRDASAEAHERYQREREAAAFLSSLGPQFRKAPTPKNGPQSRPTGGGGVATRSNGAPSTNKTISTAVTASLQESEDRRQQVLQRLKATHCSVNQEKVWSEGGSDGDAGVTLVAGDIDVPRFVTRLWEIM